MNSDKIDPSMLITKKIPFLESVKTYQEISKGDQSLGMLLIYSPVKNSVNPCFVFSG